EGLPDLLRIDAAHVVMLASCGLLSRDVAAPLLRLNRDLAARHAAGEDVLGAPAVHRGLVMLYEQAGIEQLGERLGGGAPPGRDGASQRARSRNDINATIARRRARAAIIAVARDVIELGRTMADQAARHATTVMPGFTHLQPAQPTTFGHYLTGVLAAIVRGIALLDVARAWTDRCPMGAAAGFGTAFPIDADRTASLLGFASSIENSADAVASRDYLVVALTACSIVGTVLTRIATDLQTWASAAHGFICWPDDLVSTSSIMPQKRNAFVLENVRGE